jgi:ABC-type transporter Mla subunit MlaD
MTLKKILKLFAFDIGVGCLFALLLAKPFLGRFLDSFLYSGVAAVILLAATGAFVYVNWKALSGRGSGRDTGRDSIEDCVDDINGYISSNIQTFRADLDDLSDQLEKLQKRKDGIRRALLERFQPTELAFAKFSSAADRAESYLLSNARDVLSRVKSFDEEEYENVMNSPGTSREEFRARKQIYDDMLAAVSEQVSQGDKVILALDKLLNAVSTISTFNEQQSGDDAAVKEIDGLVKDVEFYRGPQGG